MTSEKRAQKFRMRHFTDLSLRSKRFQSSYWAKVRAEGKKKVEGGGGKEKRKRLPANPTILENAQNDSNKYQSKAFVICDARKQSIPGLIDVSNAK